jgi:hypothetical protein
MTSPRFQFFNWFLLVVAMIVAASFQTTFWFQVVGGIPAPLLWLNVVLYVILYRKTVEAILINYGLALVLAPFTSTSIGMLWSLMLVLSVITSFAKKRVFLPGMRYFVVSSLGITLVYQISSVLLSYLLDPNPSGWNLYSRFLEILFTPLCAAPTYWVLSFFDRVSEKEPLPERGVSS